VKVDAIVGGGLPEAAATAARAEELGLDGLMVPEVAHDPFLPLVAAAGATSRIRLATGIAVAFARSPMTVAVMASDLHRYSAGRFVLGLGTQIKPHISRRFSMEWSSPAPRLREFVQAVRAIWRAWEEGSPLRFEGAHYRHTLMTPMFSHGPSACGWPAVHVAAVGPVMTAVAGEVADGLLLHGFTTADYVRDVTLPNLQRGLDRSGRRRSDVEVAVPAMIALAADDRDPSLAEARATVAFYGSTPAYRAVLEHHGWGALGDELHAMSRRGEWNDMGRLVDDDVLHTFVAVGDAREVAAKIAARFGDLVDRIQLGAVLTDPAVGEVLDAIRGV
jgi:probable F420-dependent oxidoreductase